MPHAEKRFFWAGMRSTSQKKRPNSEETRLLIKKKCLGGEGTRPIAKQRHQTARKRVRSENETLLFGWDGCGTEKETLKWQTDEVAWQKKRFFLFWMGWFRFLLDLETEGWHLIRRSSKHSRSLMGRYNDVLRMQRSIPDETPPPSTYTEQQKQPAPKRPPHRIKGITITASCLPLVRNRIDVRRIITALLPVPLETLQAKQATLIAILCGADLHPRICGKTKT